MEDARNNQKQTLIKGLHKLYQETLLTDVVLMADDVAFPCHRNVLAASSQYFRAMFTSEVRESEQKIIPLHGMSPKALDAILTFLYTGEVAVTNDNAQTLFMAASMFEVLPLIGLCGDHMIKELYVANGIEVYKFAKHHSCEILIQAARNCILENFTEIVDSKEVCHLEMEDLLDLICRNEILVEREEIIFETIIEWVNFDLDSRKCYLPKLFKEVRLPLIDEEYYAAKISSHELIVNDTFCKGLISIFKQYCIQTSQGDKEHHEAAGAFGINCAPRLGMFNRKMLVFSGGGNCAEERSFTTFDPVTKKNYCGVKQHPSFDFKFKIEHFQLISVSNNIYFLGGILLEDYRFAEAGMAHNDVFVYDFKQRKWLKKSPMLSRRCCFTACSYKDQVVVTGGRDIYPTGEPLDSCEIYDTDLDVWQPLPCAPLKMYNHAAAILNENLFIFGGLDDENLPLDTVFRYNIPGNTWTVVKTELIKPRAEFAAIGYGEKIYLVGGATKQGNIVSVDIYHPHTNRWTFGEDFPEERKCTSVVLFGNCLYLCGGVRTVGATRRRTRHVESKDLYRYDLAKNKWTKEVKFIPYANLYACAVAMVNTSFLEESDFISSL